MFKSHLSQSFLPPQNAELKIKTKVKESMHTINSLVTNLL